MSYSVEYVINLDCSSKHLFSCLTDQMKLSQWFLPQVITTPVEGTVAAFAYEFDLNFKMELIRLEEDKIVHWECVDGYKDWLGSKVMFLIKKNGDATTLHFSHTGLTNEDKKDKTIESWRKYLEALKYLCEK